MKSPMMILQLVLNEMGTRCGTSTNRDWKTIVARYEHEGLSFITITLPDFGKDFERSLDQGKVDPSLFSGFSRRGGLPRFLGGFLDRVFDRESALLLEEPSIDCIYAIRQITLMFGKIGLECSPKRVQKAIDGYLKTEQDVRLSDRLIRSEPDRLERFVRVGRMLWADFFSSVDSRIYNESVVPKHGPGTTADKLRGNAKYKQRCWTSRLEALFPHWEQLVSSDSPHLLERMDGIRILEPRDEIPVRVITVPKTLKTPRIIAIEPTCMQYMQQGVLAVMMQEIPRFNQTRELVQFERQEPNQRLALEGSVSGALATLDLSEASDRVSNQHVRLLLANHRWLRQAVDATRSRKADVQGKTIRLSKFASMGSALCFPMEAIVFATVVFCGIEQELGRRLTIKDVESLYGAVRVYGDDIIVPVNYVQSVIQELETFGFRVNTRKSFWTGKFRESCGKEYYDGHDVSIVRMRSVLPESRQHVEQIVSTVAFRNLLFQAGFDATVDFLDKRIRKLIPFPFVEATSTVLGRLSHGPYRATGQDKDTQAPLVKGVSVFPKYPVSQLDDYGALLKFFINKVHLHGAPDEGDAIPLWRVLEWHKYVPSVDKEHLQRAGRPVSVRIKHRWASPF
ncbi:RNA-directed RNA polymerase [ssRNA phage Gerhypos.4_56]|uniref:RNA-directed RNA polymerase n=2 Tax=Leviviricetes TaxID=2842243 RepID=A0A8S5L3B0_9VIRU|nr:RNA-directed RNA polymerase [ssRNA phage Gerhypos.4_56]QDH88108.1 MAG: RNA-dependent RNA polymerase [Leviviridae sp.]DAD51863.1 TPA_asm: RNA-directed RNA polymerase [ssRNA phage Gerhypos.4_56]